MALLSHKGFAGRQFEQLVAGHGARLLRPDRKDEPDRHGSLGRWRQWIESTFDTLRACFRPSAGSCCSPCSWA